MYDLAIIGAGPAGSTLARLLDKDKKVLLLERRRLDLPLDDIPHGCEAKCCGGTLNPAAQREMARQGLSLPKDVLCGPQPFMVRARDLDNGAERMYQRHYINIHRERFDRHLFSLAQEADTCDIRCGASVVNIREIDGVYELDFVSGGKRYKEKTAMIAAADGGSSLVRRRFDRYGGKYCVGTMPYYTAIQERIELDCSDWDSFGAYFAANLTDYYSWAIPKEGYVLLGAALKPGKYSLINFERMKNLLIHSGLPFGGRIIARQGAILQRPEAFSQIRSSIGRAVFLGEAGGFISPSSSEGISWAMKTAAIFAEHLNTEGDTDKAIAAYDQSAALIKLQLRSKSIKSFAIYNPFVRNLIFKSRVTSIRT